MKDLSIAIARIRKYANEADGFKAVAEVLESLGSLENACRDAQSRLAALRDEEASQHATIEELKEAHRLMLADHERLTARLTSEADTIIAGAQAKADDMLRNVSQKAADMIAKAASDVATAGITLSNMQASRDALAGELASLTSRLEQAKQAAAAIIGGN